ncbi:MAG TPA: DUF2298 domain-containing protein [Thermomicrobiales bacterium]|nr:DUF2298 domain-containing protein [Thermomicrobiales bacterium]
MTTRTAPLTDTDEPPLAPRAPRRSLVPLALLVAILVVAAVARIHGLNWDDGKLLHPDERFITDVATNRIHGPSLHDLGQLLDPDHSPLNPRSVDPNPPAGQPPVNREFAYGSLPLFVTDAAAFVWGALTRENWHEFFKIFRVGRALTVGFDLATVALVYALGRRAYGTVAGLLGAAFFALAVMPIQLAHFWVTDTWLTTFVTATLLAALVAAERGTLGPFLAAGVLLGLAVATKGTALIVAFALLAALALAAARRGPDWRDVVPRFLGLGVGTALAAFVAFFLFEPYAVLDPRSYLRDLGEQSAIISGRYDVPYTRQYVGTLPLVYQAKNLLGWDLGPLLGALALIGLGVAVWRVFRRRRAADIVLLAWVVPYLLVLATYQAKFTRYLLPVVPVFVLFAATLLTDLGAFRWARASDERRSPLAPRRWLAWAATAVALLALIETGLMAAAFEAIYDRPHTRIAASEWIYSHVPAGAKLSAETWDDPLPLILGPGRSPGDYRYQTIWLDLYNDVPQGTGLPNNEATFDYLYTQLSQVDYVVESSQRLYGSIPRLPWRYPVQEEYFTLLFAGRLGFTEVYQDTSFPTLGPFSFNDRFMDESFSVYDHPPVLIFKKTRQLSRAELRDLFAPALAAPLSPTRQAPGKSLMLGQFVDRLPAVRDFDWSAQVTDSGAVAVVLWLALVELLGLLALPLVLWLFRGFPDRGWGLSKLAGWLLLAYPLWLGASLRLTRFTLPYALGALVVFAVVAALAAYRWRATYRDILRGARVPILVTEGVFLAAGAFFLWLRVKNPDLWHTYWGGEKPMELAHLNAILRSVNFPPYDPWYADGYINYYYFGSYLIAVLVKITGIPVDIAFNLGMPTISALLGGAAASISGALAPKTPKTALGAGRLGAGAPALRRRSRAAVPAFAVLGALAFVGIGNLDGFFRLLGHLRDGASMPLDFDFFWGPSRAVDGAITEFPYFTQVWADLHAHAIALPFTLLAIGTVVAAATAPGPAAKSGPTALSIAKTLAPYVAFQALVLGALFCTNTWDMPTYLLVTGLGLFVARCPRGGDGPALGRRLGVAAAGTLAAGGLLYVLYLPFFRAFWTPVGGLARTRVPTPLPQYLDHFGLFVAVTLLVAVAGLCAAYRRGARWRRTAVRVALALAALAVPVGLVSTRLTAALAGRTPFTAGWTTAPAGTGTTAAFLLPLLVLLVALWVLAWGDPRLQLPLTLLIAAVGVTLGPELVFVADDLQGGDFERMNTVFKFYLQGWSLFALGGVGALAWLYDAAPRWSLAPFHRVASRADRRFYAALARIVPAGALAALLLASFVYPVLATPIRVATRFPQPPGLGPTLDGYRWMLYGTIPNERCQQIGFKDDYAAIEWMLNSVSGTPVIAEASIGPYRGDGSRFAIATGFPTILGWDRHEYQQRPALGIQQRDNDVRTLYNSPDQLAKLAILQRYHVSFVVVGAVERHWYLPAPAGAAPCAGGDPYASPEGLTALEAMQGQYLTPVFRSGETVIYRVLPAAYSAGVDAGATWTPR